MSDKELRLPLAEIPDLSVRSQRNDSLSITYYDVINSFKIAVYEVHHAISFRCPRGFFLQLCRLK